MAKVNLYVMGLVAVVWDNQSKSLKVELPKERENEKMPHLPVLIFPCDQESCAGDAEEIAEWIGVCTNRDRLLYYQTSTYGGLILHDSTLSITGAMQGEITLKDPPTLPSMPPSGVPLVSPRNRREATGVAWIPSMERLGRGNYQPPPGSITASLTLQSVESRLESFRLTTGCDYSGDAEERVFVFDFKEKPSTSGHSLRQCVTDVARIALSVENENASVKVAPDARKLAEIPLRDGVELLLGNLTRVTGEDPCELVDRPGKHFALYYKVGHGGGSDRVIPHKGAPTGLSVNPEEKDIPHSIYAVSLTDKDREEGLRGALNRVICALASFGMS